MSEPIPTPTSLTLFPAQERSAKILLAALTRYGAALDSSETGTGKTVKACEVVKRMGRTPVVICPKSTIPGWKRTMVGQGLDDSFVFNYEKIRRGNTGFVAKTGKSLKWTDRLPPDPMFVFDEVQACKGHYTLNAKLLIAARATGAPILMLSATAAEDPSEMRAIGYALGLHTLKDYFKWAKKWGCTFDNWNQLVFDPLHQAKLHELNKLLYPSRGHKLVRSDLGHLFAISRILSDPMDFGEGDAIRRLYEEMDSDISELRERSDSDAEMEATRILRLRQEVELLKVPETVRLIEHYRSEKNAVVFFANFNDTLEAVAQRLKEPHGFVWGRNTKDREDTIQKFQTGKINIILCNIMAGGVGVNLHDEHGVAPRVSLINPTYNVKDLVQTLGRVDRIASKSDSVQHILVAQNTIEETVAKKAAMKKANMDTLHKKTESSGPGPDPAHAEFSPSGLKNFDACPGYRGEDNDSEASRSGTRIHNALETDDLEGLSDYEALLAESCQQSVTNILHLRQFDFIDDYREIRVDIELGGGVDTFGTCDRFFLHRDQTRGLAMDYKTGEWPVDDAEHNHQAKAYTVGLFQRFPTLQEIEFWFILPRRDELTFGSWKRSDLPKLRDELRQIIERAKRVREYHGKGAPLRIEDVNPVDGICDFCANKVGCPAVDARAFAIAKKYGSDDGFELPDQIHGHDISDPQTISDLMKLVPVLEKWCSGVKKRAREMVMEEGQEIPDYEVKERSGQRKITSPIAAWRMLEEKGVSLEDFLETVSKVRITEYENLIKTKTARGEKKTEVERIMAELFESDALTLTEASVVLSRKR